MLNTYDDEEEMREFIDSSLGIFIHKCGCVNCCICDDSHKYEGFTGEVNYGDDEDEYDWD